MRLRPVLAAALAAAAVLLPAVPAHAAVHAPPGAAAHHRVGETVSAPLSEAIASLPVAEESREGYERTKFRHWIDADRNGCNTRAEVLIAEAVQAPAIGAKCALEGGVWVSPYDDLVFTDARLLDVDHVVPLAEAWDSGASAWTAGEREAYANDLGDGRSLVAVSARSNRAKADKDISEWLPPLEAYRCTYLTDWTAVKTRWGLAVDGREREAMEHLVAGCPDETLTVTLAR
ncbi:HNH endonuclease family protein [Kitasatospora sp. NPDC101447]|uniref:HNH endonuclease family protein n=1 Tax=Kitasatospora sp. NPDC101447 TaxID=3364102 RepID=UPI003820DA8F